MKRIDIVLGVICNAAGDKALVARRPDRSHLSGLWEFPGGKVRDGEAAPDALKRELYEEVNIRARECTPLISFDYDYPGKPLRFSVWKVHGWDGELRGKEGQETRWVDITSLAAADFPPANKGIIAACKLPPVYLITPDLDDYTPAFMGELQEYAAAGVRLVQFRSKKPGNRRQAAIDMICAGRSRGASVLVNSTPEFAMEVGASGVHLTSERLLHLTERPLPAGTWVAASCHNARELAHAVTMGVDFCVLSPVRNKGAAAPASGNRRQAAPFKEDIPGRDGFSPDMALRTRAQFTEDTLGWDRFSEMVSRIPIPVYALGGMKLADLDTARQHGAQGVALISDVWNRPNSAGRVTRALHRHSRANGNPVN